jgi:hypothetical protein
MIASETTIAAETATREVVKTTAARTIRVSIVGFDFYSAVSAV